MVLSVVPSDRHSTSILSRSWVQNLLPLVSSLLLHGMIVLIGIALYQVVQKTTNPNRDQVIIPESGAIARPIIQGHLSPLEISPPANDPVAKSDPDFPSAPSPDGGGSSAFTDPQPATGDASGASPGKGVFDSGIGTGSGIWHGPGGAGIGNIAIQGIPGGNARKVVFLCDASGSMLGVFGQLKQELRESINKLDPSNGEQFNVIFFSDGNPVPLFNDGMRIATQQNKKIAMDFIENAIASGGTAPLPAIKFAMSEKPEVLYVLTDGFDQIASFDEVINAFRDGNKDGRTHVNCIFLQSDEDPKLEAVLKQIAAEAHGTFKKVLKSEM